MRSGSYSSDMPIYVCRDSVDVWAHPELFQLNKNLDPEMVAGVPRLFCPRRSALGKSLYNFEYMKRTAMTGSLRE